MNDARPHLPADAAERRRLWREWIHVDAPARPATVGLRTAGRATDRLATIARRPEPREGDWLHDVLAAPAGVIAGLSAAIRGSLVGSELPASDRARLLRRAERLGLNRFEANLLIAAVQNRARSAADDAPPRFVATLPRERSFGVARLVACAVAVEAIVGAIAIHLLAR